MMDFDVEKQYSPSLHTKRFQDSTRPDEKVLQNFLSVSENATTAARQACKTRLDVRYGGEKDNQLLDIYFNEKEEGTPIFVYIHGGYWQLLDKSTSGTLVMPFKELNYRVILVDYNLSPDVTLQEITEQICNFYKWLKIYADETKAPKISICGHSAGAHLAVQMFKEEFLEPLKRLNLIEKLFLISGLYDLRQLWHFQSCNPNNILHLNAESSKDLSPICWLYNKDLIQKYQQQGLEIHVLVAENDSQQFKMQSEEYCRMLKELNLNAIYKEFKNYDHFDIIEEFVDRNSAISQYLLKSLQIVD